MFKSHKAVVTSMLIFVVLLSSVVGIGFVFAQSSHSPKAVQLQSSMLGQRASIQSSAGLMIDMSQVPEERAGASESHAEALPLLTGISATAYAQDKAAARQNSKAPKGTHPYTQPAGAQTDTPIASVRFQGMANSSTTCSYFGGCQPPDMALATSSSYVLQGVNTSFNIYNTSGVVQGGWPKNAQNFFSVPNPSPSGCDAHGPFLSDPRAFYDLNDDRFWAATLQIEGAFGIGRSCSFVSTYWIAYSLTSNPTGSWCRYSIPMSLGTTNAADYTQFGFDRQAVYFSANMFNNAGTAYQYAEAFGFTKPAKNATSSCARSFIAPGFTKLMTPDGVLADTVQPVETEASTYGGPNAGLFISSYNINSGGGVCSSGCSDVVVWAMGNPGTPSTFLTAMIVGTGGYSLAPNADEPGNPASIETLDTRISGTPVYHNGLISFTLETAFNNGSQVVPAIFWGQVSPFLNDSGALSYAFAYQYGYQYYGSDGAASFGAVMPDRDGDLFMVFEFMSAGTNPEVAYVSRRVTLYPGTFHDGGFVLRSGDKPTLDSRWGDFEATSYDSTSNDNVWFAGQYSPVSQDWSTFIGRDKYTTSTF